MDGEGEKGSCRLELVVQSRASREEVTWSAGGPLRVRVTAAPERGKANTAVVAALASRLGVPRREVRIVSGQRSRRKVVELPLLCAEVMKRLEGPRAPCASEEAV